MISGRLSIAVFLFGLLCASPVYSETSVEIFEIHYSNAQELVGAVKVVLSSTGVVSVVSSSNALIVRDYPKNLKAVGQILKQLDRKPKNINVNVEFIDESGFRKLGIKVDWSVSGAGWSIGTIPAPGYTGAVVTGAAKKSSLHTKSRQFIKILENRPGKIFVGENIPFQSFYYHYGVNHGYFSEQTTFKDAGTSFSVLAKTLPDNKIRIRLTPKISYYDRTQKTILVKNATTEVITDDPGSMVIGGSDGSTESLETNFLSGVKNGSGKTRFVMILSVASE